jgi:hypothetical protein
MALAVKLRASAREAGWRAVRDWSQEDPTAGPVVPISKVWNTASFDNLDKSYIAREMQKQSKLLRGHKNSPRNGWQKK